MVVRNTIGVFGRRRVYICLVGLYVCTTPTVRGPGNVVKVLLGVLYLVHCDI